MLNLDPIHPEYSYQINWFEHNLRGKPKVVTMMSYQDEIISGFINKIWFGKQGFFEESELLFPSFNLFQKVFLEYDGNRLKKTIKRNAAGLVLRTEEFKYNDKGSLINYKCIDRDKNSLTEEEYIEYHFDTKGELEKATQNQDGTIFEIYFQPNKEVDYIIWNGENNKPLRKTFEYQKDSISSETIIIKTGQIIESEKVVFDDQKRILNRVQMGQEEILLNEEHYRYDQFGNIIEQRIKDKDEYMIYNRFNYIYDQHNNWIEQSEIKYLSKTVRKIEYYE